MQIWVQQSRSGTGPLLKTWDCLDAANGLGYSTEVTVKIQPHLSHKIFSQFC